jgi:hypothetical protein
MFLERRGFEMEPVDDLRATRVQVPQVCNNAEISVAMVEVKF